MLIKSKIRSYEVNFCNDFDFVNDIKSINNKLVVIDKKVYNLYKNSVFPNFAIDDLYFIEALESNKNINTAIDICNKALKLNSKRNSTIISIGGGIIQDITGFAANILYRGINWIFIPTTLLAQTDSCIGSKTSLNHLKGKNIFGTFYPPDIVYIDIKFLKTLEKKDYNSGLGEIVKLSLMNGHKNFEELKNQIINLIKPDFNVLEKFIHNSLNFKKKFIEADEFDFDVRKLLNYGHTFGHSFESVSNFEIPHGQGVALGIMVANQISKNRGLINNTIINEIEKICKKIITIKIDKKYFDFNNMRFHIKNDKKREGDNIVAILLNNDFKVEKYNNITEYEIEKALNQTKRKFINE